MISCDTAVIGSGISGLTAALALARSSKGKVILLEKHSSIAPLLRSFHRDYFTCEPGFHYSGGLVQGGILKAIFKYLGVLDDLEILSLEKDGYDIINLGGREFRIPMGFDNVRRIFIENFPESAQAVNSYISFIQKLRSENFLANPCLAYGETGFPISDNGSLKDFLFAEGASPEFIEFLDLYGFMLYGVRADEVSLRMHSFVLGAFYESASRIKGGGESICAAFEKAFVKADIEVFCNSAVKEIRDDGNRVLKSLVLADGTEILCKNCVFTPHPAILPEMISSRAVRPIFLNKIRSAKNTFSPFVVYISCALDDFRLNNRNFYKLDKGSMLAVAGPHPDERGSIAVLKPLSEADTHEFFMASPSESLALKKAWTEKVFSEFINIFPELNAHSHLLDSASPLTLSNYTSSPYGSIYGIHKGFPDVNFSPDTDLKGLFMAGQSMNIPGFMGALESGIAAAVKIAGKDVWAGIREAALI